MRNILFGFHKISILADQKIGISQILLPLGRSQRVIELNLRKLV
jgi:hypothetical protein